MRRAVGELCLVCFLLKGRGFVNFVDFPIVTLLQIFRSLLLCLAAVEHLGHCLSLFFVFVGPARRLSFRVAWFCDASFVFRACIVVDRCLVFVLAIDNVGLSIWISRCASVYTRWRAFVVVAYFECGWRCGVIE